MTPATVAEDIRRLAERAVIGAAFQDGQGTAPEPLFDPSEIKFRRYLEAPPPPRRWLLEDVLPLGVTGLMASMGGAGKSYLAYQLGISVGAGLPFLGWNVPEPGAVLYIAAEDDEDELHRRGLVLLDHYTADPIARDAVAEHLHVVSRVGRDNLLTNVMGDGEVRRRPLVERLIESAIKIPDLRLIILDPISRFRGGQANNEEHATRFVEALEAIREATGATVLGLAHVSQAGIRDGGGQEIVRGSTALVDGVRWVATLQRMRRDQAPDWGVSRDDAPRYLRLEIPKSNYAPPFPGVWLRRELGGVLVPVELDERRATKRIAEAEATYLDVLARLQRLLREHGPMTRRRIREFAGVAGPLGAGDHTVRSVIERAVQEGALIERHSADGVMLYPPAREDE